MSTIIQTLSRYNLPKDQHGYICLEKSVSSHHIIHSCRISSLVCHNWITTVEKTRTIDWQPISTRSLFLCYDVIDMWKYIYICGSGLILCSSSPFIGVGININSTDNCKYTELVSLWPTNLATFSDPFLCFWSVSAWHTGHQPSAPI